MFNRIIMVNLAAILFLVLGCEQSDEVYFESEPYFAEQDCATKLNHWTKNPAACILIRDNKVLLVWVPYSNPPGWDFPGGHEKGDEFACQTAQRETCEETGYSAKALKRVSDYVFTCEVTGENVCTEPVDEGFLKKQWFTLEELDSLQYRDSWGDKLSMMKKAFAELPKDTETESSKDTSADTGIDTEEKDTGLQQDTNTSPSNDTGANDTSNTSEESENSSDTHFENKDPSNNITDEQKTSSNSSSTGCSFHLNRNTSKTFWDLFLN